MNYTPGPWAMKSADSRHIGEPYRAVEITSSKSGLAYQWATVHGDDRVANARLIAAAPELLAACQEVMRNFVAAKAEYDFKGEALGVTASRAAIAKAMSAFPTWPHASE